MNVWTKIPLSDYEEHMSHPEVGQLQLIDSVFREKLKQYYPESVTIWGIAGGNGLQHIDTNLVSEVVGLDINPDYLDSCKKRYADKIKNLKLINLDLNAKDKPVIATDFIWAALVFEYLDVPKALAYASKCLQERGLLSILIQKDNGKDSVSTSIVESVKLLEPFINCLNEEELTAMGENHDLHLIDSMEYQLPDGKYFVVLDFIKSTDNE